MVARCNNKTDKTDKIMAEQYEQIRIKKSVKDFLAKNKTNTGVAMSTYVEQAVNEKKQRDKLKTK
jgi:hypothetical protein